MKLSFIPGQLFLNRTPEGDYVITVKDEEVYRGRNEKKALTKFGELRKKMEEEFPTPQLTPEQKRKALENLILDKKAVEVRNSTKIPIRDKPGKTRTFG